MEGGLKSGHLKSGLGSWRRHRMLCVVASLVDSWGLYDLFSAHNRMMEPNP